MPWVYLDDNFPDHPKVVSAGGDAAWLYVCGLAYCKRYNTGGAIPAGQVARLSDRSKPEKLAALLVAVGLWEIAEGGFQVHDYVDWNKASDSRSEAGRKAATARWRNADRNANASKSHSDRSPPSHAIRNANASESHMPQDALSLSHPYPIPNPLLSTTSQSAAASTAVTSPPDPIEPLPAALISETLTILANRRLAANGQVANPAGYRRAVIEGLRQEHAMALADLQAGVLDDFDWTAELLADWLEPAPKPRPATRVGPTPEARPLLADQRPPCDECAGRGMLYDEETDTARPCDACNQTAIA